MITRLKRWFFGKLDSVGNWLIQHDICEICHEETVDLTCVGCKRRICINCDSGYYADETLCTDCRKDITPEEEAADRADDANSLAGDCHCPGACELSPEEHEYIAKYATEKKN